MRISYCVFRKSPRTLRNTHYCIVKAHYLGSAAISKFQGKSLRAQPRDYFLASLGAKSRSLHGHWQPTSGRFLDYAGSNATEYFPGCAQNDGPQFGNFEIAYSTCRMTVDAELRNTHYAICTTTSLTAPGTHCFPTKPFMTICPVSLTLRPSTKWRGRLPAARRSRPSASCASCLPSAPPVASSSGSRRHRSTWPSRPCAGP